MLEIPYWGDQCRQCPHISPPPRIRWSSVRSWLVDFRVLQLFDEGYHRLVEGIVVAIPGCEQLLETLVQEVGLPIP